MSKALTRFLNDEQGATSIEYAAIAGLVSIIIVGSVTLIGQRLNSKFLGPVANGIS